MLLKRFSSFLCKVSEDSLFPYTQPYNLAAES